MRFGYSMPVVSPLYPEPPYCYKGNQLISIVFRTTSEILHEIVPKPLVPNSDNLAFFYIGEFNVDSPLRGNYKEAGIGVPVLFGETLGSYLVYLYLDSPLAIVPGREIWGWPKKDAVITLAHDKGTFYASVSRGGVTLISASVNASEQVQPIPDQPNVPVFNFKLIPSAKKNNPPDVMQLTSALVVSEKKALCRGQATLSLNSSPTDDLGRIPILAIISGEQYVEDMRLDCGDIAFDYLAEKSAMTK
jgi:acetoacetate decarboxylase